MALELSEAVRKHYADYAAKWHKTCCLCGVTDHADFGDWVDEQWFCDRCVVQADNERAARAEKRDLWLYNA